MELTVQPSCVVESSPQTVLMRTPPSLAAAGAGEAEESGRGTEDSASCRLITASYCSSCHHDSSTKCTTRGGRIEPCCNMFLALPQILKRFKSGIEIRRGLHLNRGMRPTVGQHLQLRLQDHSRQSHATDGAME